MENVICQACGQRNTEADSVCRSCGQPLATGHFSRCSNGHIVTGGSRFCPWCGEEIGSGGRGATERYQPGPDSQKFRETRKMSQTGGRQTQVLSQAQRTRIIRPGAGQETAGEPRLVGFLVSYSLDPDGFFFILRDGRQTLGSGSEADLRVEDTRLSREHAVLLFRHGRFIFEDRLSSNGSFLNGQELIGQREIFHGDRLALGEHQYILIGVPQAEGDPDPGREAAPVEPGPVADEAE